MTSASELFSTRRSRTGRSEPDLESDPSLLNRHHSHHHHHHHRHGIHHHNHRHDSDGCDPLRRPPPRLRRFCLPERRHVRDVQGTVPYLNTNSIDSDIESNSSRNLNGSDRLPGAVLLARARLFERLRGLSLSSNSRSNGDPLGDNRSESSFHSFSFYRDPNFQPEVLQVSYERNKKPQGLTQGAINCLHRQTFSSAEMGDCSICLESFTKGDMLISLPCTHTFHSSCLKPWLRVCGDCPYCRRAIAKE